MAVLSSSLSPVSYINTTVFVVSLCLYSFITSAIFTLAVSVILASITTYIYNIIVNKKHSVNTQHTILITGCSTGIGYDSAIYLARQGYTVYAGVRKQQDADRLVKQHKNIVPVILDVTKQNDIDSVYNDITRTLKADNKKLVALINNAGYGEFGPIELLNADDIQKQYSINVFGLIGVTQTFLPLLRQSSSSQRTSRLINVSSVVGRVTMPNSGLYASTKHAVEAISDALRCEVSKFNIDVIDIQPGAIQTSFRNTASDTINRLMSRLGSNNHIEKNVISYYKQAIQNNMNSHAKRSLKSEPSVVTEQIYNAIHDSKPLAKYLCGVDAQFVPLLSWLPSRIQDYVLGGAFRT